MSHMRWLNGLLLTVLALVFILLPLNSHAHADFNNFDITNFEAYYFLSKSDPQGHLDITENIAVDFHDYNHGILRAIPNTYHHHPLNLKIVGIGSTSGAPSQFTTYASNNNTVLKIGDPTKLVHGAQTYVIKYSLDNVITYFKDHDELFWDINGDQWPQSFNQVTAHFYIPAELSGRLQPRLACFTGSFGSQNKDCQTSSDGTGDARVLSFSANNLAPYQTLSTVIGFTPGSFTPYSWRDTVNEHLASIAISLISLFTAALVFRRWQVWGKDPKGSGVIVPQYGPPKDIDIVDAGILQDYRFDNRDVTAVIIDLAIRGYLAIIEENKKKFLKKTTTTTLVLKKTDDKLADYEMTLLQTIFGKDLEPGSRVTLGTYISGMQTVVASIGKQAQKNLESRGFFDKSPDRPRSGLLIVTLLITVALSFIGFWSHNYFGGAISVASTILIVIFIGFMPRRTKMGVMYSEELAGLKLYLQTAEADRIKMLQSPNAKYAANSGEPKRTVQLFEKLLPYAIIFAVEKDWAGQFADIYKSPPDWYQGNWNNFNAYMLASHISSATSSFNSSFSPPSSSSSSGFSGGGAGGGGGGGGGGGW